MQITYAILSRGMSKSTTFFHIISQTARISKEKKMLLNIKCIFSIISTTFVETNSQFTKDSAIFYRKYTYVFT